MNQTLDDLEKNQNNIETPNKRKKRLKWLLIFLWILLSLGWAWAWLTKAWFVPNWFNIDFFKVEQCWPRKIYSWKVDSCYQKCMNWCAYKNCASATMPFEQDCSSDCHEMCDIPRYKNCVSNCKNPEVEWYSETNYSHWCEWKHDKVLCENPLNGSLIQKEYYEEWVAETLGWYEENLKEYESCMSDCWYYPTRPTLN